MMEVVVVVVVMVMVVVVIMMALSAPARPHFAHLRDTSLPKSQHVQHNTFP